MVGSQRLNQETPSPRNLDYDTIENMISDLYQLIRKHCKSYHISGTRYELFLHDSTRIEYDIQPIIRIEQFLDLLDYYWDYFPYLISHLSYEDDSSLEISDRRVGTLDFQKTGNLQRNQGTKNVVCSINTKNVFLPENDLLGAVLLGTNRLANKFLQEGQEGLIDEFKVEFHGSRLHEIVRYTGFLLKDRTITKLVNHYLINYENIEQLATKILSRISQNKIKNQYRPLIRFIQEWRYFDWILNVPTNSLRKAMTPYLISSEEDRIYEMWIFFKILTLLQPLEQQKRSGVFINKTTGFSVEYHYEMTLNWILEKPQSTNELRRIPDILIKKDGKNFAIIDAKCMKYGDSVGMDRQEPGPDGNIVNQMLIYVDYGRCDIGIVLFADERVRDDIIIKQGESRKLIFLNCYPFSEVAIESFNKIRNSLSVL